MSLPRANQSRAAVAARKGWNVAPWNLSKQLLDDVVRDELARFTAERGSFIGLCAWLTPSTRGSGSTVPRWIGVESGLPEAIASLPWPSRAWTIDEVSQDCFRLVGSVDDQLPQLGQVVALFSTSSAATEQHEAIRRLAQTLRRAVRQHREDVARQALAEFPTAPARLPDAHSDLLQMASIVEHVLDADGAKIYVLRRSADGPMLWRLCNSQAPNELANLVSLATDHGLADWVLREEKWLLLPDFQTPVVGVAQQGVTDSGKVTIIARAATEIDPAAPPEAETSVLSVPLTGKASVAGVLSVWREDPSNYPLDATLDRALLEQFAPQIAAACQRLLQLQKAEEQLAQMSQLARVLAGVTTLEAGYDAVADATRQLADAACALLLHHHHGIEHGDSLYPSGVAISSGVAVSPLPLRARTVLRCRPNAETWQADIKPAISDLFAPLIFRGLLTPPAEDANELPRLTVALFDAPRFDIATEFPSDELLGHFARAFLQSAVVLLERHVADLATHLADELEVRHEGTGAGGASARSPRDPQAILEQAGQLLLQATSANAALLYRGTPNHMTVRASSPFCPALFGLPVGLHSLTRTSLREQKAQLVLEAESDYEGLTKDQLCAIAKALRWSAVRSWLCCPVVHHGRVLGMIKLLTHTGGDYLGASALDLTLKLAGQVGWEMFQAGRRQILESLPVLSREIASFTGKSLGEEMASRLCRWAEEILLRPQCKVYVLADIADGTPLVRAVCSPGRETATALESLAALERFFQNASDSVDWSDPANTSTVLRSIAPAGVAHTVSIPGGSHVRGHILFADDEEFSPDEQEAVREAIRAMAVLLNTEAERNRFKQMIGRFRHAILGPIQGIKSNALVLAELAKEAHGSIDDVLQHEARLLADIEILRLWRENERFYLNEQVEILLRRVALRPLVERCFERYYPAFAERGIEHELSWLPRGDLQIDLDEHAFDLALSNLLDNACKYSFSHRQVVVQVRVLREPLEPMVQLMVEDTGHGIDEAQFKLGQRERRSDPFRLVPGEGLGIRMAKAIVDAHHGMLSWHSEVVGLGRVPDTTPHRVRFYIRLPFHQPYQVRRPK